MSKKEFAYYCFKGTYREVGLQYGETMKDELKMWNLRQLEILSKKYSLTKEKVYHRVNTYLPIIKKLAPDHIEQLQGMAYGADLSLEDALLFQVYGEITNEAGTSSPECTVFSISSDYTGNGKHYAGQNCDMNAAYAEKCSVVTFAVENKPRITYLLPIGYLSYHGLNSEGISCNHNALFGSPWKFGLPRFFTSRLALESRTMKELRETLARITPSASRHSFFADCFGNMTSYEFDAMHCGIYTQKDGYFVHTNHYRLPKMQPAQKMTPVELHNSEVRQSQMEQLINDKKGVITELEIMDMLRNHDNGKDSICVHDFDGVSTFASIISCLDDGKILIAKGNPCCSEYKAYPV